MREAHRGRRKGGAAFGGRHDAAAAADGGRDLAARRHLLHAHVLVGRGASLAAGLLLNAGQPQPIPCMCPEPSEPTTVHIEFLYMPWLIPWHASELHK